MSPKKDELKDELEDSDGVDLEELEYDEEEGEY